jgi:hypothetical protein
MKISIVLSLVFLTAIVSIQAQGLIPKLEIGDVDLQISGYAQYVYTEDGQPTEFYWPNLRVSSTLSYEAWSFVSQVNLAHADRANMNWLRLLYAQYELNDSWQLRVGRVCTAGFWAVPPPAKNETVSWPLYENFTAYGWGVQTYGKFGDDWSLLADITARSGQTFDNDTAFQDIEGSVRVTKQLDDWQLAATAQISADAQRFGTDATWQALPNFYVRGAVYSELNSAARLRDSFGMYGIAVWRVQSRLELHSRLNYARAFDTRGKFEDNIIWTNGLRLFGPKDNLSFTVDYESALVGECENRLLARIQFLF